MNSLLVLGWEADLGAEAAGVPLKSLWPCMTSGGKLGPGNPREARRRPGGNHFSPRIQPISNDQTWPS